MHSHMYTTTGRHTARHPAHPYMATVGSSTTSSNISMTADGISPSHTTTTKAAAAEAPQPQQAPPPPTAAAPDSLSASSSSTGPI